MPFLYSGGNFWIEDPPRNYRHEVVRVLDLIRSTHSGRTVIKFINLRKQGLYIMRFQPTAADPVNAITRADNWAAAYSPDSMVMMPMPAMPSGIAVMMPTGTRGTGVGSPVTIRYHPANARQVIANKGGKIDPGDGPGEILLHEMVHALRMLSGIFSDPSFSANPHMDDFEEFYAITIQDVYRSERGFQKLRRDHWGHHTLAASLADSDAYYEEYKDAIDKWFVAQKLFCLELANVRTKFNPFLAAALALGYKKPEPTPMAHR